MEGTKVYIKIRGKGESWETSLLMTEQDALNILALLKSNKVGICVNLPSINGFAKVNRGNLDLTYNRRESIDVPLDAVRTAIEQAINDATAFLESENARKILWEWINKRYDDVHVLILTKHEPIEATLLQTNNEYIAVLLSDGSIAVTNVMNEDQMPPNEQKILLSLDEDNNTIISSVLPQSK